MTYERKRAFLAAHRAEATGLGVAAALAAALPIVGLIAAPAATVAAAFLYASLVPEDPTRTGSDAPKVTAPGRARRSG